MVQATTETIGVDGRDYLFSLEWQPLTRASSDPHNARIVADRADAAAYVIHKERESFCLGLSSIEVVAPSAASSAARTKKGVWIAVIKLEAGRYWLVGSSHGEIISGTDRLFTSGSDAFVQLKQIETVMDFEELFLAEGVESSEKLPSLQLDAVVSPGSGTNSTILSQKTIDRLKAFYVRSKKRVVLAVIIGAIVASGGSFAQSYYGGLADEKRAAEQASSSRLQKFEKQQQEAAANDEVSARWLSTPKPSAFLAACNKKLNLLALPATGWLLETRQCKADIEVTFRRDWGTDRRIRFLADRRAAGLKKKGNDRAVIFSPLSATSRPIERPLEPDAAEQTVQDIVQSLKLKANISARRKISVGLFSDRLVGARNIDIQNIWDPFLVATKLDDVAGLVLISATKKTDGVWTFKMELYDEKTT
ncbi:MAG: type 4b pilus protein PilO2 [Kordiimonadaceae bacterium]|nr:type 4b pilus protein PilO2 [Kordiimonadaceae bacterium]